MKSTIKKITLTVDELRNLIDSVKNPDDAAILTAAIDEAAQNPQEIEPDKYNHPSARLLTEKFREKANRLEKLRNARKLRRQQKAELQDKSAESPSQTPSPNENTSNQKQTQLTLALNDHLARSIAWIYNNRMALSVAIKRINEAIAAQSPSFSIDPETIRLMIDFAEESYGEVLMYNNRNIYRHPAHVTISLTQKQQTVSKQIC